MDYISALKAFADYKMKNDMSPRDISLYYALLFYANKHFWKPSFEIPTKILMQLSGINSPKTLSRSVKELEQRCLIIHSAAKNASCPRYAILPIKTKQEGKIDQEDSGQEGKIDAKITGQEGKIDAKITEQEGKIDVKITSQYNTNTKNNKNRKNNKREKCAPPQGRFQNVLITFEEKEELENTFGEQVSGAIESLSEYMESTGKTYNNHFATLYSWLKKDIQQQEEQKFKTVSNKFSRPSAFQSSLDALIRFAGDE